MRMAAGGRTAISISSSSRTPIFPAIGAPPRYLRALVGVFPAKDVIVWTPAEIAGWINVPNAFISTVLREGVTLYER